ncbi:MAG TPA: glycoside hydrolase family 16 protein [Tepidisphaeraceae bacterium]|nr:glycoside hydrolase family 16 protein [Tepidisphaeraceae bacterium]
MNRIAALLSIACLVLVAIARDGRADSAPATQPVTIDDFEKDMAGWDYANGAEFPGAKGSLALDTTRAHTGHGSLRLETDLTGGGLYTGAWRNLDSLSGLDVEKIDFWVLSDNVKSVGVRLADHAGQTFQSGVTLPTGDGWHEVSLQIPDLIKGEHWGGPNDGKRRGPIAGFGINIGKTSFISDTAKGAINIDDITAVPGSVASGQVTVLAATIDPPAVRPGFDTRITYRFDAQPMGRDFTIFVHGRDAQGKIVIQADHEPPVDTAVWDGKVEYTKTIYIPIGTPDGEYKITLGLYDNRAGARGWDRPELKMGPGVTTDPAGPDGARSYYVGAVKVDSSAPLPTLPPATLDLSGYRMTFDDEFKDLSISEAGPDTRWFTATKDNFGDSRFMPEKDGFPFSLADGILPNKTVLRIALEKRDGQWQSGIIASADPKGGGFSQKFGYFEMRAKFPPSLGTWPAFWLLGQPAITERNVPNPEIDVVEGYGVLPHLVISTSHVWNLDGKHLAEQEHMVSPAPLSDGFHRYGVDVEDDFITFYFDGIPFFKQKTNPAAKVPLYMLVNLAMGGGWPIDQTVSPSCMYVDYVRAYAKK